MPPLPTSLSPHIAILQSTDLNDLLKASSLPPLHQILQSFSPLPQVTTRTTSLTSVPHTSFTLRFSDLAEVEDGCREGEEERAVRTIDWITTRISTRCAKWVEDMDKIDDNGPLRTPWWDELRRCAEGEHTPSKVESWNHPVAVILAVSTMTPNPLQVLTALHARPLDFPSWVDPAILRYTLVIHPQNSNLSDEEAGALFNAVKKQYGLHSYLLSLILPSPPPPPVSVPTPLPRLPSTRSPDTPRSPRLTPDVIAEKSPTLNLATESLPNTLRLGEKDIQMTARFTREFLVMSLIPWMEKCVVEWNENFSSTRRLPSRLFSSTRRLFGSTSASTASAHSSTPSLPSTAHSNMQNSLPNPVNSSSVISNPLPQQRRLAEFATILGDFKLAASIWESMRKDGKGGSDILPLLLTPAHSIQLHASTALANIHPPTSTDPPVSAQLRAVIYAVRWEVGMAPRDFSSNILEGEKWLVWAAGKAEEAPSALLLAHAALLSARKQARRKAALWYLFAANRLEKCGIKPLTMYFLRRAHELYKVKPEKNLSPSFWDAEGPAASNREGLDAVITGIEHPLGRLLYTTGNVPGAVRLFLGLLGRSPLQSSLPAPTMANGNEPPSFDKIFLEDFRVAYRHFKANAKDLTMLSDLKLPFTFCLTRQTRLRLPRDIAEGEPSVWEKREEDWKSFWRTRGKEGLQRSGKAAVDERFWVDLVLRNPLDTEVNLSDLKIVVEEAHPTNAEPTEAFIEVEPINDVILGARETQTIPVPVKSRRPASLVITQASYNFLSLLPSTESLSSRGSRLHETALQRQSLMYAPSVQIKVEVEEASHKLIANFVDDKRLVLAQGENKRMRLWLSNAGAGAISELWMVAGPEDQVWVAINDDAKPESASLSSSTEILHSQNSLAPCIPYRIDLASVHGSPSLGPGDNLEFTVVVHAERLEEQELCLLFVYRAKEGESFRTARVTRRFEVKPIFEFSATAQPSGSLEHLFVMNLDLYNVGMSSAAHVTQVTTLSPSWKCSSLSENTLSLVAPHQSVRLSCGVNPWHDRTGAEETLSFVTRKLGDMLHGRPTEASNPPPIDILCSHILKRAHVRSVQDLCTRHFIYGGRRNIVSQAVSSAYTHVPVASHPFIFPLYHPSAVDIVVSWEIPSQQRSGHLLVSNITLGAGHAALREVIKEVEGGKLKRSMYAETQREKSKLFETIRNSEWNAEMNPVFVTVQDGVTVQHDFSKGSCHASIAFTLRNCSLTHTSRYVLRFASDPDTRLSSNLLPPRYSGRLTFRGTLQPTEGVTLQPMMWITRPGMYGLGGWLLETEVGELPSETSGGEWQTRHRYLQGSPLGDTTCITICGTDEGI